MFKQRRMDKVHSKVKQRHDLKRAVAKLHIEKMSAERMCAIKEVKMETGEVNGFHIFRKPETDHGAFNIAKCKCSLHVGDGFAKRSVPFRLWML